jgi:DNA polymerase I-like protein with 3'-5' exonuclease and polymerase domains/intein/homing endonuclease
MITTNYQLVTTADELRAVGAALSQQPAVGFDSETTSLDPYAGRMRLVQLAAPDGQIVIIDLDRFGPPETHAQTETLAPLRQLLAAPRPVKVAHNAKFDAKWVKHQLGVELGGLFDTLLASQLVSAGDTEDRHGLQVVAERYLNETVDKAEQLSDWSGTLSEAQLDYAARDAAVMLPLRDALIKRLKSDGLVQVAQLEFECVMAVACLELAGLFLDKERWREQIAIVKSKRAVLAEALQAMLAEGTVQGSLFENARADINLDSHTQLTAALKRLNVPLPDSTRNWKLQPLAADYPVIAKLLDYRTMQKSLTSYGENILDELNPATGRIHANFHQIGAPTGRFACLAGDTLISTPHGFKRIDALSAGDMVQTSYGRKRIEAAWCNGVREVYLVTLTDGRQIKATADHKFLTGDADTWKQLRELKVGERLFVSLQADERDCHAPTPALDIQVNNINSRKPVALPATLSVELCELLGLILADGYLGKRHVRTARRRLLGGGAPADYDRLYIACGYQDQDLIETVIEYGHRLFECPFVELKSQTCRLLCLASTKVAEFLSRIGVAGNAHTKRIPEIILTAPAVYRAALLRGLFEGDGHKGAQVINLCSVNRDMLRQAQLLLADLGIYSRIRQKNDLSGFTGSQRFELIINGKSSLEKFMRRVGFMSARKNAPFNFYPDQRDGVCTPFILNGAALYREAAMAGLLERKGKNALAFATQYKRRFVRDETAAWLISRYGVLPSLKPVKDYLDKQLRPAQIAAIELVGTELVYDISVADVHEFIANGIVVHNCTNPNVQQVPHAIEYRRCFRAPAGRKLVISDYSQIELRILAHITEDQGFIEAFNSGADLHRVTAAQVFNVPLEGVTKEQRDFAKRLNFGVVYGDHGALLQNLSRSRRMAARRRATRRARAQRPHHVRPARPLQLRPGRPASRLARPTQRQKHAHSRRERRHSQARTAVVA